MDEIQKVNRTQGIESDDKHVEVIVSRMLSSVRVTDAGEARLLPGEEAEDRVVMGVSPRLCRRANGIRFPSQENGSNLHRLALGVKSECFAPESPLSGERLRDTE